MFDIKNNAIFLTRGDSAYITIDIKDASGDSYILNDGDVIKVQVRTAPNNGELLFQGTIEEINGEHVWHILPIDTFHAEVTTYWYDAQICLANGDVFTFIPASKFKLLDEVTCNEY